MPTYFRDYIFVGNIGTPSVFNAPNFIGNTYTGATSFVARIQINENFSNDQQVVLDTRGPDAPIVESITFNGVEQKVFDAKYYDATVKQTNGIVETSVNVGVFYTELGNVFICEFAELGQLDNRIIESITIDRVIADPFINLDVSSTLTGTSFGNAPAGNDNPAFVNAAPGETITLPENTFFIRDIDATDPNGDPLTYSIVGGADAGRFAIDPNTGELIFLDPPDFDDDQSLVGNDDIYDVTVRVEDGNGGFAESPLFINITPAGTPPAGGDGIVDGENFNEVMGPGYNDNNAPTNGGGDQIDGSDGDNDVIRGNDGADTIDAGAGNDTVNGDSGQTPVVTPGNPTTLSIAGADGGRISSPDGSVGADVDLGPIAGGSTWRVIPTGFNGAREPLFYADTVIDTQQNILTLDFDNPVKDTSFTLFDVNAGNWSDQVVINAFDENGNLLPVNFTNVDDQQVNGNTIIGQSTGNTARGAELNENNLYNVDVNIPGNVAKLVVILEDGPLANFSGYVALGNFNLADAGLGGGNGGVPGQDGPGGDDVIDGGAGADALFGDGGNDTFLVDNAADGAGDVVVGGNGPDQNTDNDTLDLRGAGPVTIAAGADATDAGAQAGVVTFADGSTLGFSQIETILQDPAFDPEITLTTDAPSDPNTGLPLLEEGGAPINLTITRNGPTDQPLVVTLINIDPTETGIQPTVTIPAGAASVTVPVNPINDPDIDGNQFAPITAAAPGFPDPTIVFVVADDDNVPTPDGTVDGEETPENMGLGYDDSNAPTNQGGDQITNGNDDIDGNGGDDTIDGAAGDDVIDGGDNDDVLDGGAGNDTIDGGNDDDLIDGGPGADVMRGGDDDDTITIDDPVEAVGDIVDGGAGGTDNDTLDLRGAGPVEYVGLRPDSDGNGQDGIANILDPVTGAVVATVPFTNIENLLDDGPFSPGPDGTVDGEDTPEAMGVGYDDSNAPTDGGGDQVTNGPDQIDGNDGDDTIDGGAGNDTIDGGNDDDLIDGGPGADVMRGGDDDDTITIDDPVEAVGDIVDGGAGGTDNDTLDLRGAGPVEYVGLRPDSDGNGQDGIANILDPVTGAVVATVPFTNIENLLDDGPFSPGPDGTVDGEDTPEAMGVGYDDSNAPTDGGGDQVTNGPDQIDGNDGDDTIDGGAGNDTIDGGNDDDLIDGGPGADVMRGGDDDDTITIDDPVEAVGDIVDGGAGGTDNDTLDLRGAGPVEYVGLRPDSDGNGQDGIANILDPVTGAVVATVPFTNIENLLDDGPFSPGPDGTVDGEDTPEAMGPGYDDSNAPTDGGGDQVTNGDDSIDGNDGDDTIDGGAGNDTIDGGNDDDLIDGGPGADVMRGGDDDDTITIDDPVEAVGDIVDGGAGGTDNDTLDLRGAGPVEYVGLRPDSDGNGQDGIANILDPVTGAVVATVPFTNIENLLDDGPFSPGPDGTVDGEGTPEAMGVGYDDSNAPTDGGGDQVTNGPDQIDGNDGDDTIDGGAGNDTIDGGNDDDLIDGGPGADVMRGGDDDDTITIDDPVEAVGDIVDGGAGGTDNDTLDLRGAGPVEYVGLRPDSDGNGQDGIANILDPVTGAVVATVPFTNIENLLDDGPFSPGPDGTVDGEDTPEAMGVGYDDSNAPTDGGGDVIGNGDDSIDGNGGDDTIDGGNGDDTLNGGDEDDLITGGAGADVMNGGNDDDTIVIDDAADAVGDVVDGGAGGTDNDTLDLTGAGPVAYRNLTPDSDGNGQDGIVDILDPVTGEVVASVPFTNIENFVDDGPFTPGPDGVVDGEETGEVMTLGYDDSNAPTDQGGDRITTGDDVIDGNGGDDSIGGSDGDDTINGGDDDDLLAGEGGADVINGGNDSDTIVGTTVPDMIGDVVDGGAGGNDFDVLDLRGLGPVEIIDETLDSNGNGTDGTVVFQDPTTGAPIGTLTFAEIEEILSDGPFVPGPDGVVDGEETGEVMGVGYDDANAPTNQGGDQITDGDDTIDGNGGADTIDAGNGDDVVDGGDDDDVITGGAGSDTLNGGDDDDTFIIDDVADAPGDHVDGGDGGTDFDTLDLRGAGPVEYVGLVPDSDGNGFDGAVQLLDPTNGSVVTVVTFTNIENFLDDGPFEPGGPGPNGVVEGTEGNDDMGIGYVDADGDQITNGDNVVFGFGGEDNITTGDGNDQIFGGDGEDNIRAGRGNDVVNAGADTDDVFLGGGADILVFEQGGGHDRVRQFSARDDKVDLTDFGFTSFAEVQPFIQQAGRSTVIDFGDDGITLLGVTASSLDEDNFILGDSFIL